eukprot:TRINITY_DN33240_c0_g1_i1.p1 TRINITY_DN33240_c0_g1~~TRINITY_DN33240_c0_g1_i1.p1  ORF type:complete len:711 (-),score=137.46 TRINITY_DN33240_c0_g1_i1:192-2324(-)
MVAEHPLGQGLPRGLVVGHGIGSTAWVLEGIAGSVLLEHGVGRLVAGYEVLAGEMDQVHPPWLPISQQGQGLLQAQVIGPVHLGFVHKVALAHQQVQAGEALWVLYPHHVAGVAQAKCALLRGQSEQVTHRALGHVAMKGLYRPGGQLRTKGLASQLFPCYGQTLFQQAAQKVAEAGLDLLPGRSGGIHRDRLPILRRHGPAEAEQLVQAQVVIAVLVRDEHRVGPGQVFAHELSPEVWAGVYEHPGLAFQPQAGAGAALVDVAQETTGGAGAAVLGQAPGPAGAQENQLHAILLFRCRRPLQHPVKGKGTMPSETAPKRPQPLRVAANLVVDAATLDKARAKAAEHGMSFSRYLEKSVRLYGKVLDKKVSVVPRPLQSSGLSATCSQATPLVRGWLRAPTNPASAISRLKASGVGNSRMVSARQRQLSWSPETSPPTLGSRCMRQRVQMRRTQGPWGVVNSNTQTRPPGLSTRRISARAASRRGMLRMPKAMLTAAKVWSAKGRAVPSPASRPIRALLLATFLMAGPSMAGTRSRPTTRGRQGRAATAKARSPVPVATSSTLSPGDRRMARAVKRRQCKSWPALKTWLSRSQTGTTRLKMWRTWLIWVASSLTGPPPARPRSGGRSHLWGPGRPAPGADGPAGRAGPGRPGRPRPDRAGPPARRSARPPAPRPGPLAGPSPPRPGARPGWGPGRAGPSCAGPARCPAGG